MSFFPWPGRRGCCLRQVVAAATAVLLAGCGHAPRQERPDEVAMYGGMDRSSIPQLKAADDKLIADASAHFGSREKAGRAWVEQGFRFYRQHQLGMAMRRFNQAWLLDPANPEAYVGFASVLHDQGRNCPAMAMMDKVLALNPPSFQGIYPDAGRVVALCAVRDPTLSADRRAELLARSEALYRKGEEVEWNKRYVYGSWATAYYWRGQYPQAWAMVARQRAAGGSPDGQFLDLLRGKMPEP